VKRREFITLLGGAAVLPLAARAQQTARPARIGVLVSAVEDDPRGLEYVTAFAQGLAELGWTVGRNLRIEYRWGAGDLDRFRRYAAELVALSPDVVLASSGSIVGAFQQASRTVPIVFVTTVDPVGGGWVDSLSRPGTNAAGFAAYVVAVIRDPSVPAGSGGLAAIQTVAPSLGVELTPVGVRDAGEIERAITASNGGPILVGPTSSVQRYRDLIIALAARHRLPAIYPGGGRLYVTGGGLISYGPDPIDQYRRAAGYVDRILKGEKPADLPVRQRAGGQPQDRQGAGPRNSADVARPRRRGDRVM